MIDVMIEDVRPPVHEFREPEKVDIGETYYEEEQIMMNLRLNRILMKRRITDSMQKPTHKTL